MRRLWIMISGVMLFAASASAKVWLLPDYQQQQIFSHRVNGGVETPPVQPETTVDCRRYGMIPASEVSDGMSCSSSTQILETVCYGGCSCSAAYSQTSSSCRSEGKIPAGSSCMGEYFTDCICDTSLYPHTSSSCAYTPGGASCSDDDGKHFAECKNPCDGLTDNETDLGCEKYYDNCPSLCELGKTCVPNDCSGYSFAECPEGALCDECYEGCGGRTYYQKTGCRRGYEQVKKDCEKAKCPPGYGLYLSECGSIAHGTYHLSPSLTSYYSGDANCHECFFNCDRGYTEINGICDKYKGAISLTFEAQAFGFVEFSISNAYNLYLIDWGDGEDTYSTSHYPNHTYNSAGTYKVVINGNITRFAFSTWRNITSVSINQLDLETVTNLEGAFFNLRDTITGVIPEFPPNLKYAKNAFGYCQGLSGSIPDFPESLYNADSMFWFSSGLTGETPKKPSGLNSYTSIFSGTNVTLTSEWSEAAKK